MKMWNEMTSKEKVEEMTITCQEDVTLGYLSQDEANKKLSAYKMIIYSTPKSNK